MKPDSLSSLCVGLIAGMPFLTEFSMNSSLAFSSIASLCGVVILSFSIFLDVQNEAKTSL